MKITNYPTYIKKQWKTNKGRFVNSRGSHEKFVLPIDDNDKQMIEYIKKIKSIVMREYKDIYTHNYYNAELK